MSWLSSFMHPERGYNAAQDTMNNYYNQGQGYLNPYNTQGQQAGQAIGGAMNKLLDPVALQDEWMKNYNTSEQAKQALANNKEQGLGAASSMGLMGSSSAIRGIEGKAGEINANDRQSYLNDLMQKYMGGVGLGQSIYGTGAQAAGQMGQNAMNMGQNSAGLQFGKTNAPGDMFGKMGGSAMKLIMDYLTGGMGTGSYGRGAWSPTGG